MSENEYGGKLYDDGGPGSPGRVPPHDLDAERSVIGAMLVSEAAIGEVAEILVESDFYSERHRMIFSAVMSMHTRGEAVDRITLTDELKRMGLLQQVGGEHAIWTMYESVPVASNAARYAELIKDKSIHRALIDSGTRICELGFSEGRDGTRVLDAAEQLVFDVSRGADPSGGFAALGDVSIEVLTDTQRCYDAGGRITGLASGFGDLDRITTGIHDDDLVVLAARPAMGKLQPVDSRVVTPTGWRRIGDMRVGDLVAGRNGRFYRVTGVFPQGQREVFDVRFSDGTQARAGAEHLWFTSTRLERKRGVVGSVRNTAEIARTLRVGDKEGRLNHRVPYCGAVHYPNRELPLDPYVLGVWLGDGCKRSTKSVAISNPEPDVVERVAQHLPGADRIGRNDGKDWNVVGGAMAEALVAMGLSDKGSHERWIPAEYLTGSIGQRERLLRGLVDSDGYVTDPKGACIEYSTTSPELRDGIKELVLSLGGRLTWSAKQGTYKIDGERKDVRVFYRINISFPEHFVPASSEKHLAKWRGRKRPFDKAIVDVVPAGEAECVCISVGAKDGLYLTDDYVVTHNTSMALGQCWHTAGVENKGVALFSLEMSKKQIGQRLVSLNSRIPIQNIRTGNISGEDWPRLVKATNLMSKVPLHIDDSVDLSISLMRSRLRRLRVSFERSGTPLSLVVVDYLQLMVDDRRENRQQEIAAISRAMKVLARDLGVPVLLLSQLSRAVEQRNDKRPMLSDLRESGAIEQDADMVQFLYRDEYYNEESEDRGIAEVIVAKHRNGATGRARLAWLEQTARFESLARDVEVA